MFYDSEPYGKVTRLRLLHLANIAIIIYAVIYGHSEWFSLPEQVPVKFDFSGHPYRYEDKFTAFLMIMVIMPVLMTAIMYGLMILVEFSKKRPGLVNIPNKEKFFALPEDQQKPFWNLLKEFLAAMALSCNVMFVGIGMGIIEVAEGVSKTMPFSYIGTGLTLVIGVGIIYPVYMFKIVKRLVS